ncbi:flagellar export chaperone FliS [Pectinatus cerevisiiphilus]|uniref:Flagellar secretion chaperone FliS n=1 Tax=Pectinatus cerevisiiphilus TaxID=86956 RepID=A0A4R3K9Q2_9FIRM|nr:flagellar export chaperone FliS [Pectinatus cerevisiiphilus]TCS79635.1 flagellar protein FliS [Pectinatus cerevisiiphilus]
MQNASYTADAYKRQQILTASPEMLTLMLYNGGIRFINEGIKFINEKNCIKSNKALLRAQDIMIEFMATLNMDYDIARQLYPLYNYIYRILIEGNMKNNTAKLEEAKTLLTELRDTWHEAMKIAGKEKNDNNH